MLVWRQYGGERYVLQTERERESCCSSEQSPSPLIRWLTSVQSGKQKRAPPTDPPSQLQRRQTNLHHPLQLKTIQKVKGMKGLGCWGNRPGRGRSIDLLHITTSDVHVGSCLLITARNYTRRLLCQRNPGNNLLIVVRDDWSDKGRRLSPQLSPFSGSASSRLDGQRGKKKEANENKEVM